MLSASRAPKARPAPVRAVWLRTATAVVKLLAPTRRNRLAKAAFQVVANAPKTATVAITVRLANPDIRSKTASASKKLVRYPVITTGQNALSSHPTLSQNAALNTKKWVRIAGLMVLTMSPKKANATSIRGVAVAKPVSGVCKT